MSIDSLEKRTLQVLSCDPNLPILEAIINEEFNGDLQYVSSEFPILTDNGYGFLDIIGKDQGQDLFVLFECKSDDSLLPKAVDEANYYKNCLSVYGSFQSRNLIGLYHRALLGQNLKSGTVFDASPLILSRTSISRHSGLSLVELASSYRTFMSEWISRNYQISNRDIDEATPNDAIPVYLVDRLEKGERNTYVAFYGLRQSLSFAKLAISSANAPLKLEPDKTHYETMHKIEGANENRFSIQFHRHGHSRPMLFFEVDQEFSACFVHSGKNQVGLNGYYESDKVLGNTKRVYGLVQAEDGRYTVKESKNNRVTLEIYGRRSRGEIRLNFLDRIYMDDDITLSSSRQNTLENH